MSAFVFRHRFWLFALTFSLGFGLYAVDHVNAAEGLLRLLGRRPTDAGMRAVFSVGALCVLAGAAIRTWATAYLRTDVVHDEALHTERLVASGPYRHVRNPLYLGAVLLAVGFGLMASRLGFAVIVGGVLGIVLALIRGEELALAATHGASFEAYRSRVPALLPSPWPRMPAAHARPRWAQALVGEGFMWIFALAAVVWVATLRFAIVQVAALSGVVFQLVAAGVMRRRARGAV